MEIVDGEANTNKYMAEYSVYAAEYPAPLRESSEHGAQMEPSA